MGSLHYFAYGSNMLPARLHARGVHLLDVCHPALADDFELVFNKESIDGSSKANLVSKPGAKTWGVLFSVDPVSLAVLDDAEGAPAHYRREYDFTVRVRGEPVKSMTYFAQPDRVTTSPIQPYDWYLALIVAGARACPHLPREWIDLLRSLAHAKPDTKIPTRKTKGEAIAQLEASGFRHWQELLTAEVTQ